MERDCCIAALFNTLRIVCVSAVFSERGAPLTEALELAAIGSRGAHETGGGTGRGPHESWLRKK